MGKIYKCHNCGNEYTIYPGKCEVSPDCVGAGFFIDLASYDQLELKNRELQEEVSKLKEIPKIEKKEIEFDEELFSFIPKAEVPKKSRLKGTGTTLISVLKTDEDKKELIDISGEIEKSENLEEFQKQVKSLSRDNKSLMEEKVNLQTQVTLLQSNLTTQKEKQDELERLRKQTERDTIIPLKKEKDKYKLLFFISSSISIIVIIKLIFFT